MLFSRVGMFAMIMTDDMYEGCVRDNNTMQRFTASCMREKHHHFLSHHMQSNRATPTLQDRKRDRVYEALPQL